MENLAHRRAPREIRTSLAVPLLREGVAIGAILISAEGGPAIHRKTNQICSRPSPTKP